MVEHLWHGKAPLKTKFVRLIFFLKVAHFFWKFDVNKMLIYAVYASSVGCFK